MYIHRKTKVNFTDFFSAASENRSRALFLVHHYSIVRGDHCINAEHTKAGGGGGAGSSPAAAIYSCREEHEFENGVFLRLKDRAGIWDFFTPSFLYIIFDIIQHTHDLTLTRHPDPHSPFCVGWVCS